MGRDVVAYVDSMTGPYDNYQCKFYDHPLHPGDVWLEIGKLCYYTSQGEYALPRRYRFVSPQGAGTSLLRLFEKPAQLKASFLEAWDKSCANRIIPSKTIPMDAPLQSHVDRIDFTIFGAVPPATLVEEHAVTAFHVARFGGGLPPRIDEPGPPPDIGENEARYVRQLLDVYAEDAQRELEQVEELGSLDEAYRTHLQQSREEFFSAECLSKFTRDYLPPGCFGSLQRDINDGVREVLDEPCKNSLARVKATTKHAKILPIDGHPLHGVVRPRDKAGICHQLANDDEILWMGK